MARYQRGARACRERSQQYGGRFGERNDGRTAQLPVSLNVANAGEEDMTVDLRRRSHEVAQGYRISVAEAGAGPAVVFLHGSGPGASGASNFQIGRAHV